MAVLQGHRCFVCCIIILLAQSVCTLLVPDKCHNSPCGDKYILSQEEIDAVCNNPDNHYNKYYYDAAPHYKNKEDFLSNTYSALTQAVITGTISNIYRQNYTENVQASGQRTITRFTQLYYKIDISISCILKYEKLSWRNKLFPLPDPVFLKSDCPVRGMNVGDNVIMNIGTAAHDTYCGSSGCSPVNWRFSGCSFKKVDGGTLNEITKSCGFQNPKAQEGKPQNVCPSVHSTDTCIDRRDNAASSLSTSTFVLLSLLFVCMYIIL